MSRAPAPSDVRTAVQHTDAPPPRPGTTPTRIALLGNPNTGKTTLFNRLCGLRHKTANFSGTTQEAFIGRCSLAPNHPPADVIDLPGIYSLELARHESEVCRGVLGGEVAPIGEPVVAPDAVCIVVDASNLPRNLILVGEVLRRRLPLVIALNMVDVAQRRSLRIDVDALSDRLGCAVVPCNARSGAGVEDLKSALAAPRIPHITPPGDENAIEEWAQSLYDASVVGEVEPEYDTLTDRLDRAFTHPVLGVAIFAALTTGLFWALFRLATYPMDWIDMLFTSLGGAIESAIPPGILRDFLANGVVAGVGATLVFLPQIALLFFLISLLEDSGYLARAAFVLDRVLRPFGLPGHSFVPLLSSHACAIPGIVACKGIPDKRERLATVLVAPFMTCSARLPVYVLVISLLFADRPAMAALAFVGCYVLGAAAGLLSALIARRTFLRGRSMHLALELPSFKVPSLRTALFTAWDRSLLFLRKAGTVILAICIILWWMESYPRVDPPQQAIELREQAALAEAPAAEELRRRADRIQASHAKANSFAGRIAQAVQPVFAPLGFDWQLTTGVVTSFAAREVFVSTMAIVLSGTEEMEDETLFESISTSTRDDGVTPVFTRPVSWALLVYYVLAMQCLPTLAVTAKVAGSWKWAVLQLVWMTGMAWVGGAAVYQLLTLSGMSG